MVQMPESSEEAISSLMDLGFDEARVKSALQSTGGNVEHAANLLFSPPPSAIASAGNNTFFPNNNKNSNLPNIVIQGSISQYDLPEGRSACSCIALAGAATFLANASLLNTNLQKVLDEIVQQGHAIYLEWRSSLVNNNSPEHTAPEDVLPQFFPQLQLNGTIRQGMLQSDAIATWHSVLSSCRDGGNEWTAVVVTKPPETILVLFSTTTTTTSQFWLIDSHSRPPRTTAASAMCYDSLPSLCHALSETFPATMLQDVPDTMLLMYNSFDLYPLRLR